MLNICQQEISLEIKKADYLSIMADETTNVSAIFIGTLLRIKL